MLPEFVMVLCMLQFRLILVERRLVSTPMLFTSRISAIIFFLGIVGLPNPQTSPQNRYCCEYKTDLFHCRVPFIP